MDPPIWSKLERISEWYSSESSGCNSLWSEATLVVLSTLLVLYLGFQVRCNVNKLSHKKYYSMIALRALMVFVFSQFDVVYASAAYTMMALHVKNLLKLLYPNLVRLDDRLLKNEEFDVSKTLPLTAESLNTRGLYIFEDCFRFFIWFGRSISPDITRNLLGENFAVDYSKVSFSKRGNEMSRKLMNILDKIREGDPSYYQLCHLMMQGEQPREGFSLLTSLVEDQVGGANVYGDWMLLLHHQLQQNA